MSFYDRDFAKNNVLAKARQVFLLTKPPISLPFDECTLIVKTFRDEFNLAGLRDSIFNFEDERFHEFYGKVEQSRADRMIDACIKLILFRFNSRHDLDFLVTACTFIMRNIGFRKNLQTVNLFYHLNSFLSMSEDLETHRRLQSVFADLFRGKRDLAFELLKLRYVYCSHLVDPVKRMALLTFYADFAHFILEVT